MKKIFLTVASVATMLGLMSCNGAPKADLVTETDSLTYSYGVSTTRGLREYLLLLDVDSNQMDAFMKGFLKAIGEMSDAENAEIVGMKIGTQVKEQMMPHFKEMVVANDSAAVFSEANYFAGFIAGLTEDASVMSMDKALAFAEEVEARKELAKYADWKSENEAWLVENAQKAGVVTTESGLQYEILKAGNGVKPQASDRVTVHYHGTTIDGNVFDSSVERGTPATFGVGQVIAGWTEALQLMPVGSKWRLYIPQELAYGSADQGSIKPFSTLIFEVELLAIEK